MLHDGLKVESRAGGWSTTIILEKALEPAKFAKYPKRFAWRSRSWERFRVLPDEQTSPEQFEAFRRMTPEKRLALGENLYWSAREWKAAWLRSQHPDWSEGQISREVARLFLHART